MSRAKPILFALIGVVLLLFVGKVVADRVYFDRRDEILADLDAARSNLSLLEDQRREHVEQLNQLDAWAARTLGPNLELVDHRLRARLNRIVRDVGLGNASVSGGDDTVKASPARRDLRRNPHRDEPDFVEVRGTLAGVGTWEQVVRALDRIEAEPWAKRIDAVRLQPRDNGERFALTVRLTTLFLPGLGPTEESPAVDYNPARLERYASLTEVNPFRVPPKPKPEPTPPKVDPPRPAPPNPGPPPFPFHEWRVTFVGDGRTGPQVYLRNTRTEESRRLEAGQALDRMTFLGAASDRAVFELDGTQFFVPVGGTLNDREQTHR